MKKIVPSILVIALILTSCGKAADPANSITEPQKIPFDVQAQTLDSFPKTYSVSKTGKLVGSSSISLSAQGIGRVDQVLVKEGSNVKKGQILVQLKDTTANYDLRLSQASNSFSNAKNSNDLTQMGLDKTISDMKLALEKATSDYQATVDMAAKNMEKAVRDSQKSNLDQSTSDANVTLAQLQASLDKSKLDYQNMLTADQQTILNYNASYQTILSDLRKFYTKIIFEGDRLYGITPAYQTENTRIRKYLGGGLTATRPSLEFAYYALQKAGDQINGMTGITVDESNLLFQLDQLASEYKTAKDYLDVAGKYLQESNVGGEFTAADLNAIIATNNGYKSEVSGLESGWVTFRNASSTFLANYKNNEAAAAAALVVQEKNNESQKRTLQTGQFESGLALEKTKTSNDQMVTNSKIALENAQSNYDNAIKNKELTMRKLSISEKDAALNVATAQEELDKLTIRAPIDGSVTRVITSVGQDVSTGTPMIEMANKSPEISFDVEASIVPLLKVGSVQPIKYQGTSLSGTVIGVSQIATDSLLYTARIAVPDSPVLLGQIATIELQLPSQYPVLPTNIIKVISDKKGEIQTLSGATVDANTATGSTASGATTIVSSGSMTIVPVEVDLGRIAGANVEITTKLDPKILVITSSVLNFDPKKEEITVTDK